MLHSKNSSFKKIARDPPSKQLNLIIHAHSTASQNSICFFWKRDWTTYSLAAQLAS